MRPLLVPPALLAVPFDGAEPPAGVALPVVPPDDLDVPRVLVPGATGAFAALPTPLGSLMELLRPPAFAGPDGTPLTPAVPAPAEPAFGEPTALPVPTEGPLAAPGAPPADAPPAAPPAEPPADPPPEPPPLCAKAPKGERRIAARSSFAAIDLDIDKLPFDGNSDNVELVPAASVSFNTVEPAANVVPLASLLDFAGMKGAAEIPIFSL